jgi:hypothetical protein
MPKYFTPHISPRLEAFFNKYRTVITNLFKLLKTVKPDIVNSYSYSDLHPPPHPKYKYTDKLYIGCIFYILKYGSTWESFIGPIPGKALNKRHNEYLRIDLYARFFNDSLTKYLRYHNIKYLSIDSTTINNKSCTELEKHLPVNKNRMGVKISTVVDDIGSPLTHTVVESTRHDSSIAIDNINDMANSKIITKALKKTNGHAYLLGDKGYDSNKIRENIKKLNMKSIISPNNRNTKDETKMRSLTESQLKKYEKRLKVENFFAIIKRTVKVNCIYEKKIASYNGLLLFLFSSILINRTPNG